MILAKGILQAGLLKNTDKSLKMLRNTRKTGDKLYSPVCRSGYPEIVWRYQVKWKSELQEHHKISSEIDEKEMYDMREFESKHKKFMIQISWMIWIVWMIKK